MPIGPAVDHDELLQLFMCEMKVNLSGSFPAYGNPVKTADSIGVCHMRSDCAGIFEVLQFDEGVGAGPQPFAVFHRFKIRVGQGFIAPAIEIEAKSVFGAPAGSTSDAYSELVFEKAVLPPARSVMRRVICARMACEPIVCEPMGCPSLNGIFAR